jgi:hypothetical protein
MMLDNETLIFDIIFNIDKKELFLSNGTKQKRINQIQNNRSLFAE